MPLAVTGSRPIWCWKSTLRKVRLQRSQLRMLSLATSSHGTSPPLLPGASSQPHRTPWKTIPKFPPPPAAINRCPEPLEAFTAAELARLDPTSARTRLFSKTNIDQANVGDVLLVRFRSGEPFSGLCITIRRRGVDTAILLRNHVLRTATEMWVKVYSPLVSGIEIVQRAEKRARRAKLTYMRKPEHDRGDLSGIVAHYLTTKRTLGAKARGKADVKDAARSKPI